MQSHDGGPGAWPDVESIVITHWHLDHWGDLVPWVWGSMSGPGRQREPVELWLPPDGAARLADFGTRLGWEDMFVSVFRLREYSDVNPFEAAGLEVTAFELPHYTLQTFGLRVSNGDKTIAYSGDTGPSPRLAELAEDADLFVCEATLERAEFDGALRGHLSVDEAVAVFEASGAKRLLITHRPRELELDGSLEQAHDGLVVEV
jgi:ribonuclease BN (tRNA processing enzyme)